MKTLKTRLKNGVKNCYLLEGDDFYLYDRVFSMIKKACNISLEDFDLVKFDDENFSMQNLLNALESMPFESDYKLVSVKSISKISENDKKLLLNYLENPSPSSVVVFFDFFNKFDFIKPFSDFVDCKRFDKATASAVIVKEFNKRNKQISSEAVDTLLDYCNGYLYKVMNEIDKLAFYDLDDNFVTKKLVEYISIKDNEYVIFELTDALGQKKGDKAVSILDQMIKQPGVLSLITNHFRRLFFISVSDYSDKELASFFGIKEFAVSKLKAQVKNFSKMQLKKIYSLLEQVDYNIKSGAMLQDNGLYYLILSILYI